MERYYKWTVPVLGFCLVLASCAGSPVRTQAVPDAVLRGNVPESFSPGIVDRGVQAHLSGLRHGGLSPDGKLEAMILSELAEITREPELKAAFDRLWEEEEIRALLQRPDAGEDFHYPLAELYYLVTADRGSIWKNKAADRLYRETLEPVTPERFAGYGLHFYTMGLLNSGKYEVAIPFLLRLEQYTSGAVYSEDLASAIANMLAGRDVHSVALLLKSVCRESESEAPGFDAARIVNVILEHAGRPEIEGILQQVDSTRCGVSEMLANKLESASDPQPLQTPKVLVEVQIITAGHDGEFIDPAIAEIGLELQKTLSYATFQLHEKRVFYLAKKEEGRLQLPGGSFLVMTPAAVTTERSRIEVVVRRQGQQVFRTVLEAEDGGVATIGGGRFQGRDILVRITTRLLSGGRL